MRAAGDQRAGADDFRGFTRFDFTHGSMRRTVYRAGDGPAIIVIHGLPGLYSTTLGFARRLIDAGWRVYLPSLFGRPGRPFAIGYLLASALRVSVTRDIALVSGRRTSPAARWLRGLAGRAYEEGAGRSVAAVGMSVTGGLALSMLADDRVSTVVLSQPVLPIPVGLRRRSRLPVAADDLQRILRRPCGCAQVLALRFSHDILVPAGRFRTLRRHLGDALTIYEIDSSPGNPHGIPRRAHAVITGYLGTVPDYPTRLALDHTLAFLYERLQ